jgi:hypothetical protein
MAQGGVTENAPPPQFFFRVFGSVPLGEPNIKTPGGIRTPDCRGSGRWLRLGNFHDPILPFVCGRSGPYHHESLNDIGQERSLFDEKHARALAVRFQEVAEVAGHRPKIGSDKNPILLGGEGQHIGIGNSFQPGLMGRKKIDCRFTAAAPGDNRIVETRIRQVADHRSASPRDALLPHTFERRPDFGRRRMGSSESILFALAFRNVGFHIFPISQIESDRTVNLLQAQCWIV